MRKKLIAGLGCAAVFLCLFAMTVLLVNTGAGEKALAADGEPVRAVGMMEELEFVVREQEGKVCVYLASNEKIPAITTEISVSSLREADRQLLYEGIRVVGRENLLAVLEDFGS